MQQQKEYVDAYSLAAPVPYDNQGFIAQTVDNILQIK
jgi:hypothetical protein